ncbi:DNA helicase [Vibrio phage D260]
MKVVLSNKVFFRPDDELRDALKKQLTYEIIDSKVQIPKYHMMFGKVASDTYWMPSTRLDMLESRGIELNIIDKRTDYPMHVPRPTFTLRDDQAVIIDDYVDNERTGAILNGKPGFGKTIAALALAYELQQKTLVICTNVDIRKMWEKEIEKFFGFSPSVIGSGRYEHDKCITVANIQTARKYGTELATEFGLLVVDEAHHCVAATFDFMVMQSKAKYKLGLTGTLWRKDGLHVCFPNYFGTHIYQPKERNTIKPTVHRYRFPMEIPGVSATPWALRVNELYDQEEYRSKLKRLANAYALLGHKVLLVSDRTELLEWLAEDNQVPSFIITGKVDDRLSVQKEVSDCPTGCILVATQSIFAEGISLNALSCVILGAPTNNDSLVEQIAGRIQRIEEGKLHPVLVDCMLKGNTGTRHARARYLVYQRRGWPVENVNEPWLGQEIIKLNSQ